MLTIYNFKFSQMKYLLLACSLFTVLSSFAQDSIQFSMYFKPGLEYSRTITLKARNEILFSGEDSLIQKMLKKGIKNPMITNMDLSTESTTTTGKMNAEKKFPVHISIHNNKKDRNGVEVPNTDVYGFAGNETMPILDSADPRNSNPRSKTYLLAYNTMNSQLEMPDKKMAIGEEYKKTYPIHLQSSGKDLDMIAESTYKLVSVADSTAKITVSTVYSMNMDLKGKVKTSISGFGSGTSDMVYDLRHNFSVRLETYSKIELNSDAENEQLKMNLKIESNSIYITQIKPLL